MEPKVIEAASHEEVEKQVTDMNNAAWDKAMKSGERVPYYDKTIVSDIETSGAVRAVVTERPSPFTHTFPAEGGPSNIGGVRNPFGALGGGI